MTKLTVSTTIHAPLEHVRQVFTAPEYITQRNFASDDRHCPAATNDLRIGGVFSSTMAAKDGSFSFEYTGQYDLIEPMKKIEYTLGEFKKHFIPAGRQVSVIFEHNESADGVKVTEIFDAEEIHNHDMQIAGWQAILENFKKVCEHS